MNLEQHLQDGEHALADSWRMTVLRGALSIVFAVVILIWPSIGLGTLIALFAAYALGSGATTLVSAFGLPISGRQRAWLALEGLVGIAAGVVVVLWPSLSALGLLYAVAAWAIAMGVLEVAVAFALPLGGGRVVLVALGGLLSVAFGVIMFARPGAGALALLALIGASAFVAGVMQIASALELRQAMGEVKHRFRPRATTKPLTR